MGMDTFTALIMLDIYAKVRPPTSPPTEPLA